MQALSNEDTPDSAKYVARWARDVVAAIGKREARRVLADYEAIAEDPKVTKHGRATASQRAKSLKKLV